MMTEKLIKVPVAQCDCSSQPRSRRDADYCRSLGENMLALGQKIPIIGYWRGDKFIVADGSCRCEGARQKGIKELVALDLGKEPSRRELLLAQASIDLHRQHLMPIDRALLFRSAREELGCTAGQLAEVLNVSPAVISRSLALLELPPDLQEQINAGTLDARRGYLLSQESDPERQRQLADQAASLSREELARQVRKQKSRSVPQVRVKRIACPLPSGLSVAVSGQEVSLDDLIDALGEAQKEAKRAREQGLDARTWQSVMRSKAKKAGGAA